MGNTTGVPRVEGPGRARVEPPREVGPRDVRDVRQDGVPFDGAEGVLDIEVEKGEATVNQSTDPFVGPAGSVLCHRHLATLLKLRPQLLQEGVIGEPGCCSADD